MKIQKTLMGRLGHVGLLLLLLVSACVGRGGVVSGSVFAITKGGDLKPARMAHVYLLYEYRSAEWAKAHPEDANSAGSAWIGNHTEAVEKFNVEAASPGAPRWSESQICHRFLRTYFDALSQTRAWVSENHKGWQMLSTDADENGNFRIAVSRPGSYVILASGQAGANEAFWDNGLNDVVVSPGATIELKLSSPAKACLVD